MDFNIFKQGVTKQGKEVLIKKHDFRGMQDLEIDKANMESETKMS